ncbi:MAG: type IX secretion system membrane protein PorP/SprF [Bacteroidales bacterium]|nr:type IX secretion system membrane protein PorP/SprF [Bacteroidales bacterium]
MKKLIVLLGIIFSISAYAQQDAMFTHYMYNTLSVNPAYVGSRDALTITGLNRNQWVGFDGAPITQTLTMHSPIGSRNLGLGASVIQDKIGPVKSTSVYLDLAVRIQLTQKSKLAFGLKGGFNFFSADLPSLQLDEQNDVSFSQKIENRIMPNFGAGLYYYRERFYAGISTPKLLENNYFEGTSLSGFSAAKEKGHYYLIMGSAIKLSPIIEFKPSTLVKMTTGAPIEIDVTGLFEFDKRFNAGLMYRTGDAFGFLCGLNISEQLAVGYSFDFSTTNSTLKYNQGSHEIMLRYDFVFSNIHRIKSPRYF